jgi:acyl-CoA reductase-like NAD-dependent aldehyde dehydrogenase
VSTTASHRIAGERRGGGKVVTHRSPWDPDDVFDVAVANDDLVDEAVVTAAQAFERERATPAHARRAWLDAAADAVDSDAAALVDLLVRSIGKPRRAAEFEARRAAAFLRLCGEELGRSRGETLPADALPGVRDVWSFTTREPRGVAALITPFNAPLNLLAHKLGPAIAVGNAAVVKPSVEGAAVTERFIDLIGSVLPSGLLNMVNGGAEIARSLVAHDEVAVVSLTGGAVAGKSVLAAAGVKPVLLELGSNSPNIVLADADLAHAAAKVGRAAFEAAGQQCISAQRVLVERDVFDEFLLLFVNEARRLVTGDPAAAATDIGPVIHDRARARIESLIERTVAAGARAALDGRGADSQHPLVIGPTILVDPADNAEVMTEEVFGPVAAVSGVDDLDYAIGVANDAPGLLQAACFTTNLRSAFHAAGTLRAGSVWINEATRARLDTYPFGGTGRSGIGREGVRYAMDEMSQLKHVGIRLAQ